MSNNPYIHESIDSAINISQMKMIKPYNRYLSHKNIQQSPNQVISECFHTKNIQTWWPVLSKTRSARDVLWVKKYVDFLRWDLFEAGFLFKQKRENHLILV